MTYAYDSADRLLSTTRDRGDVVCTSLTASTAGLSATTAAVTGSSWRRRTAARADVASARRRVPRLLDVVFCDASPEP